MKNEGILRIKVDKESGLLEFFVGMIMIMVESIVYFEVYRYVLFYFFYKIYMMMICCLGDI